MAKKLRDALREYSETGNSDALIDSFAAVGEREALLAQYPGEHRELKAGILSERIAQSLAGDEERISEGLMMLDQDRWNGTYPSFSIRST